MNGWRNGANSRVFFTGLLWIVALAGCATPPALESLPRTPGWEEHRLANQPHPYDRLFVEIDAVEDAGPTARELAELEGFLRRWVNKPGGITIQVDDTIPADLARHRTADALALKYLTGPPDEHSAFLYILFYRSKLSRPQEKPENPGFSYFPYPCAVFINQSYGVSGLFQHFYRAEFRRAVLLHEVCHALGLARNSAHSTAGHCTVPLCLMQRALTFRVRRFLTFRQPWENTRLCSQCERDLESYQRELPKTDVRWQRGFFVDAKPEYQTFTMPAFLYVHIGPPAEMSIDAVADARRDAVSNMTKSGTTFSGTTNGFDFKSHLPALALLAKENHEIFATLVAGIFEKSAAAIDRLAESDAGSAMSLPWDEITAAAAPYPKTQLKFTAIRQRLETASRSKGAATADPQP